METVGQQTQELTRCMQMRAWGHTVFEDDHVMGEAPWTHAEAPPTLSFPSNALISKLLLAKDFMDGSRHSIWDCSPHQNVRL